MIVPSALPHKKIGVAVVYNQEDQILIDRRPVKGLMGGLWEFPGGKIELGETPQDCIKREIQEELALEVMVEEHLITIEHDYSEFKVTLIVHLCRYVGGEPQPLGCEEIRWVNINNLLDYTFPEANQKIIQAIKQKKELHKKIADRLDLI